MVILFAAAILIVRAIGAVSDVLALLFTLLLAGPWVVVSAATAMRRLHDRGKSWPWLALFWVAPDLLTRTANSLDAPPAALLSFALYLAALGISVWGIVELGFLRGQKGPNRFGDDPLGSVSEVFA